MAFPDASQIQQEPRDGAYGETGPFLLILAALHPSLVMLVAVRAGNAPIAATFNGTSRRSWTKIGVHISVLPEAQIVTVAQAFRLGDVWTTSRGANLVRVERGVHLMCEGHADTPASSAKRSSFDS